MILFLAIVILLAAGVCLVLRHPAFGRMPGGERLKRMEQSAHYRKGQFHNLEHTEFLTSKKSRWEQMLSLIFSKRPDNLSPSQPVEAVKTDLHKLNVQQDQLVWFGHSSYLLTQGGHSFLVDPVLCRDFPSSFVLKPFKGTDIYSPDDLPPVDYLVITHDHFDHLDYATVKAIHSRVKHVVCPLGVGEHLEYWGYEPGMLTEMDWNESASLPDGVRITCLPARHFSGRFLKQNPTLWASFMIEAGGKTVFVGGDSGYGKHFKEIAARFPHIDMALLENGQYSDNWKYIHTQPHQLPQIIHELNPRVVQPVHNSKFALARHPWDEPMRLIQQAARQDTTIHLLDAVIGKPMRWN